MRQSNQKSRSRGRGRKPQNPMSRNFESNGPDVKIRGNASHIAEKYASLARDALSNGDTVSAENYLQHAEHYNRIVAAAQQQSEARAAEMNEKRRSDQDLDDLDNDDQPEIENASGDNSLYEDVEVKAPPKTRRKVNSKSEPSEDDADQDDAQNERKPSRTRRPRKQPVAEASDTEAGNKKAMNGNGRKKPVANGADMPLVNPEAITEDAAALPESLLGAVITEES